MEQVFVFAVSMDVGRQNAGFLTGLQHDGAGTVTEQHTGASVFPVQNAGEQLRANHQNLLAAAGFDELVSNRQRIDKPAANSLDIERRAAMNIESRL